MGSLVFQATLGGQVNLNGPNTASTFDIAVPATTGTMVTTGDSGTVTNTMLAGSIANAKLTNSSVTVGSTSIALGATSTTLDGVNIGATTAGTGAFTTLSASSTVSGTGFSTYLASPPAIGGTSAAAGAFTTLSASSTVSGTGFSTYLASPPAIGGTAAAAGTFTTLSGTTSVTTPIVKSASSLTFQTNGTTTAVTVDTSQNVGIGTTSPAQKVHIQQTSSGASLTQLVLQNQDNAAGTASAIGFANHSNSGLITQKIEGYVEGSNAYSMRFYTYETTLKERMRIDSSGNVLVGTTTRGGVNADSFDFDVTNGTIYQNHINTRGSGSTYSVFGYNGGTVGSITQNGTTGVLYNLTSDYRLKNNPVILTGAKDFVMALQPKTWDWWDGSGKGVGFIAHEFMEVAKYSGHGEKDEVDLDNNPVYQAIQPSSSEVMANLVAFIQEQQALITSLTARIAALEAK